MLKMKKPLFAAALLVAIPISAQVDVVESEPIGTPSIQSVSPSPSTAPVRAAAPYRQPGASGGASAQAELFYQVQLLQQEVLELRGMVEEQAFELRQLKKQRLDDYLDLDRRLSALTVGGAGAVEGNNSSSLPNQSSVPGAAGQGDEKGIYRNAIDLVLKQKDYDQAVAELNRYLTNYPDGLYAANAHYWLGEIFLLKNDLEQARQWFTRLLDGYPGHSKIPDAKFKLGKVYDLLGNKEKARQLLQEVAGSGTDAARLARNYLAENF